MTQGQYSIRQLTLFYNNLTPSEEKWPALTTETCKILTLSNQYQTDYNILEATVVMVVVATFVL
jgi:hypothetical protein